MGIVNKLLKRQTRQSTNGLNLLRNRSQQARKVRTSYNPNPRTRVPQRTATNNNPRWATQGELGLGDAYAGRFANVRQRVNPLQAQRLKESTAKSQRNLELGNQYDQSRAFRRETQQRSKLDRKNTNRVTSNLNKEVKQLRKQAPTRDVRQQMKTKQQQVDRLNEQYRQAEKGRNLEQNKANKSEARMLTDLMVNRSRFNKGFIYMGYFSA